jgi:hypothetical protein
MKKISILIVAMISMGIVSFSSCKKGKDDVVISQPSRKNLIVNTWVIEKYLENGEDISNEMLPLMADYRWQFRKDGTYELLNNGDRETGTWTMDSNEENLELLSDGSMVPDKLKILRLASKEMWLMQDDGVTKIEVHFKPK